MAKNLIDKLNDLLFNLENLTIEKINVDSITQKITNGKLDELEINLDVKVKVYLND